MGVSNTPGGMVDANHLLLLKVGVGLLSAGGGPLGGVGCRGAGDIAGAGRLTERWPVVSWPRFSRGGGECGSYGGFFWVFTMVLIQRTESSFPSSLFIFNPFGAGLMYTASFTFLYCRFVTVSSISTSSHSISWPACQAYSATADLSKAASLQAALCFILVVRLPVSPM